MMLVGPESAEGDLALRMRVPRSAVRHCLEGGASLREQWQAGGRELVERTAERILELALQGNVLIRGWGACVLLRGVPHVARIRVCASIELRERVVMTRRRSMDRAAARREIDANDAARRHGLRAAFGVDREDARLYDLVLNTDRIAIDTCVQLVCELVAGPEFDETAASRAILADKVLEARVRARLRERFTPGTGVGAIRASACAGKVVLRGTAIHSVLAQEAARIVGALDGVKDVLNRIEVVRGPRGL
jgi:cytidylate kinase